MLSIHFYLHFLISIINIISFNKNDVNNELEGLFHALHLPFHSSHWFHTIYLYFELFMADPVEEAVLKEYVVDALMRCKLCNVTAANQTTWESHKQGKKYPEMMICLMFRHLKLLKKEVDIRRLEHNSSTAETKEELNAGNKKPEGMFLKRIVHA